MVVKDIVKLRMPYQAVCGVTTGGIVRIKKQRKLESALNGECNAFELVNFIKKSQKNRRLNRLW